MNTGHGKQLVELALNRIPQNSKNVSNNDIMDELDDHELEASLRTFTWIEEQQRLLAPNETETNNKVCPSAEIVSCDEHSEISDGANQSHAESYAVILMEVHQTIPEQPENQILIEEVPIDIPVLSRQLSKSDCNDPVPPTQESLESDCDDPMYAPLNDSTSSDNRSDIENDTIPVNERVNKTHAVESPTKSSPQILTNVLLKIGPNKEIGLPKRKRCRKGHAQPETWVIGKNQKLREHGLPYEGLAKLENSSKRKYVKPRKGRTLGSCKKPDNNLFPKDQRHRKQKNEVSRRKQTLEFHLKGNDNGNLVRVCEKMFLSTIGMKEWTVLHWVRNNYDKNASSAHDGRKVSSARRRNIVKDYFASLAKMDSHYFRADTSKEYLEPTWDSKQHLYWEYKVYCEKKNEKPVQFTVFNDIFEECKLAIFSPRKDQCDLCLGYLNKNPEITEEVYQLHTLRKNEARAEMEADLANPENKFIFTMDVQAVMVCPVTRASASYFKTKLTIHNFTFYDMRTEDGYCYIWDETEGDLSASVFATMITKFLEENIKFQVGDNVILWSDGCPYQNRNSIVSNALVNFRIQRRITVQQKYLEKGHTQMKCDAMHATIERKCRRKEIYLPSTIQTYCEEARINPRPYRTKYWRFNEFLDYSKLTFYPSIRPGKKKGDPTVYDLRALTYGSDGSLFYKLHHIDTWKQMECRKSPIKPRCPPRLFRERIPLKASKWKDLQELKAIMPRDVHSFYDNLPHL